MDLLHREYPFAGRGHLRQLDALRVVPMQAPVSDREVQQQGQHTVGVTDAVALVAFHALTGKQLTELALTDIVDGRLALNGRTIPLAGAARVRLAVWLDHRARTWPGSINCELFGLTVDTALRYAITLGHPDLAGSDATGVPTD